MYLKASSSSLLALVAVRSFNILHAGMILADISDPLKNHYSLFKAKEIRQADHGRLALT